MGRSASPMLHLRSSERKALKKCPQKWFWAWRQGLVAKDPAKALWFGTGIHLALAHFYGPGYKRRSDFIDVWREYANEEANFIRTQKDGLDEQEWVEAVTLGEAMLLGYLEEYGGDKHWDVIATEQAFSVRIPFLNGDGHFIHDGTFDGVYRDMRDRKKIKLMEHKTGRGGLYLPMDDQGGGYWALAGTVLRSKGVLGPKENIRSITYNFLYKRMPDDRPRNADGHALNQPKKQDYVNALEAAGKPVPKGTVAVLAEACEGYGLTVEGEVSKRQPAPRYEREEIIKVPNERKTQVERIKAEMELANAYRSGSLPIIKTPGEHCAWCPFREMCELHEQRASWEEFRDAVFFVRDPYADHRKVA